MRARLSFGCALLLSFICINMSVANETNAEALQIRIHGDTSKPALIYLPGLHGDWTLVSSFRSEITNQVCFVEFTYPRTLTWSLQDYAKEIHSALLTNGISRGWLLAESFGSQIAWTLSGDTGKQFQIEGIILAGGFVKHPNAPGIWIAKQFTKKLPMPCFRSCLGFYARYANFRHRHAPETLASVAGFIERRTSLDREAMAHRLDLLAQADLRYTVKNATVPIYAIAGFWDPIVPRVLTRLWLKKHCPYFREARMIFAADHNVLGTAPKASSETVLKWINGGKSF
jgi:pimeloyl-ACP methyl ester carboxylesterase